jgi:hypothetical protein
MGQSTGIITEVLTKIDHCELCDMPSSSENLCDVYTIEKFEAGEQYDLSKNIVVLCPSCKKNYDENVFRKNHLKACIMLRDPELSACLSDLFEPFNIQIKQSAPKKGRMNSTLDRVLNDRNFFDNAFFLFGVFIIILGVILFAFGSSNISNYDSNTALSSTSDSGQYSLEYLFSLFSEFAGVVLALLGMFFELSLVKGNAKAIHH